MEIFESLPELKWTRTKTADPNMYRKDVVYISCYAVLKNVFTISNEWSSNTVTFLVGPSWQNLAANDIVATAFPAVWSNDSLEDVIGFAVDRCKTDSVFNPQNPAEYKIKIACDVAYKGEGSTYVRVGCYITAIGRLGEKYY